MLADAQHLGAGDTGVADPAVYGQREDQHADAGSGHQRHDGKVEQDARKRQQHIDDPHHRFIEQAAGVARDGANHHTQRQAQRHHARAQAQQ